MQLITGNQPVFGGAILRSGWRPDKVRQRHLQRAEQLVAEGFMFRAGEPEDHDVVERMVIDNITGASDDWNMLDENSLTCVATSPDGAVIGCFVGVGVEYDDLQVMLIRHLVVDHAWRGRRVGVVILGILYQLLADDRPSIYYGNCAEESARFFQRCGFTVLRPGAAMQAPPARFAVIAGSDQHPCWFVRDW